MLRLLATVRLFYVEIEPLSYTGYNLYNILPMLAKSTLSLIPIFEVGVNNISLVLELIADLLGFFNRTRSSV